jgi:deoxyadenosine/deoxycytidine kinase
MQRIARRARAYELQMDPAYIGELNAAYDEFFFAADGPHARQPVLMLDTEQLDFVANPADLRQVAEQIQAALGVGAYQVALPLGGVA